MTTAAITKLRIISMLAVALTAIGLAACGGGPGSITAKGTVSVFANSFGGSSVQDAYPDITPGGQVTVVDSSGKVIGTGTLAPDQAIVAQAEAAWAAQTGSSNGAAALATFVEGFSFTATVPGGLSQYGIQVGQNRGTVWESVSEMQKGPTLTLGSLSG